MGAVLSSNVLAQPKAALSPRLTASLDVARAAAALYVVIHHVATARGWAHGPGLVLRFGQEAVLVFFLLSGFVIFANERNRAVHPRGYYLRRLRRIYPALLAAMIVSTLVAIDDQTFSKTFTWQALLGTLGSVQDVSFLKPGVIIDPYLGNLPLWSLSYEVAFYLIFPLVLRLWRWRPSWANHLIGAVCCGAYALYVLDPNHWSLVAAYFLVWWCGAMAAEAYLSGARDVRSIAAPLCWLLLLTAISAASILFEGYRGIGFFPALMLRHFAFAALILVVLFGPIGAQIATALRVVSKPAAAVASVSYGIYVLHYPLLVDWHRARSSWGLILALMLLAAAAYVADRQLNRWLPRAPSD